MEKLYNIEINKEIKVVVADGSVQYEVISKKILPFRHNKKWWQEHWEAIGNRVLNEEKSSMMVGDDGKWRLRCEKWIEYWKDGCIKKRVEADNIKICFLNEDKCYHLYREFGRTDFENNPVSGGD